MVAIEQRTDHGPWPGPRPYREADRARFFGRGDENYKVLERLASERLILLTAPSAVGKTSFLRASVVPELRRRRLQALQGDRPSAHPAVLVVRDWPVADLADTDTFFIGAVAAGIEDLQEELASYGAAEEALLAQDLARLSAVPLTTTAYEYILNLSHATEGLTLIFDQFEEALQGSATHVEHISRLIGRLYDRAENLNMLLSFREEFLIRFKTITPMIGEPSKRTIYLSPIPEQTLREALLQSAKAGNVGLTESALDELLRWMEDDAGKGDRRAPIAGQRGGAGKRIATVATSGDRSIDLLKLQALLLQLYDVAARSHTDPRPPAITAQTLEELQWEAGDGTAPAPGWMVVERALQRFIDSLLPLPSGVPDATGLPKDCNLDEEQERMLRRRRAGVRMGPSFSSGGFKVQQDEAALLARAWREEWEVLNLEVDEVEDALRDAGDLAEGLGDLFPELDQEAGEGEEGEEDSSTLFASGISKRKGWTSRGAAVDLIETSLQTLDTLRDGNVLRRKALQGHVTYELVHDGFGNAYFEWAEEARARPLDTLSATTAERGTAFRWNHLTGRIQEVRWRGCWVGPDPDRERKRLLIDAVDFAHCDLRGTVFERCDFRGGSFRNCNLGGTVFWDCTFEGTADSPFVFDTVDANGLSFDDSSSLRNVRFGAESRLHNMTWNHVTIDEVRFERCSLNQLTVGDVTLAGPLSLEGCWVMLSDLVGLRVDAESREALLDIRDCDLFYCRFDNLSDEAVDRHDDNLRYPDPEKIGEEPPLSNAPTGMDPWRQPT